MSTFDKTQSQYERKIARQRQLDEMEAAATGVMHTITFDDDYNPNDPTIRRRNGGVEGAIESARRFLWDEEDDDDANKRVGLFSDTPPTAAVMDKANGNGSTVGSLGVVRNLVGGMFTAKTGQELEDEQHRVNLAPRRYSFDGADASMPQDQDDYMMGDHDGYTPRSVKSRNSTRSGLSGISGYIMAAWHTVVGMFAIATEQMVAFIGKIGRKRAAFLLGIIIGVVTMVIVLVALMNRPSGGPDNPYVPPKVQNIDRYSTLRAQIVTSGVSSANQLDESGSPQNYALRWLTDTDPASLPVAVDSLIQRYALAVIFFATYAGREFVDPNKVSPIVGWKNSNNWMTKTGICMWYGVRCSPRMHQGVEMDQYNDNAAVRSLNLTNNNILGSLPSEIGALENLQVLDLSMNSFQGTIPPAVGNLKWLQYLSLVGNRIVGAIPTELSQLSALQTLQLGYNTINGTIPIELNRLVGLQMLGLDHNHFRGTIPPLPALSKLQSLYLDSNGLTGTIPDYWGAMRALVDLRLRKNKITGKIPESLSAATNLMLLYLDDNRLSGAVPEIFDRLTHLTEIQLYGNQLEGRLPGSIKFCVNLQKLYMDVNKFTGLIPRNYGTLKNLEQLYLSENKLTGRLPTTFGNMVKLVDLRLFDNKLSSTIPSVFSQFVDLENLSLEQNEITGTIPSQLGLLKKLRSLRLYKNKLTGNVTQDICALTKKNQLSYLTVDCKLGDAHYVQCDCCQKCF